MSGLAVMLIAMGIADACRRLTRFLWIPLVVAPIAVTGTAPDRLLMITGVVLLQLVTGNQLVRLLLGSVGAVKPVGEPQPSDKLKGGRLLGPMERLLILGLGLAGQLAAATAVVAAKSIIRFPEINAQRPVKTEVSASMTSRNTSSSAASPAGSSRWVDWL